MSRRLQWSAAAASVILFAATQGCTGQPADDQVDSSPAGWPDSLSDFSFVWTAEPDIDLKTGAPVTVRAYMESYYLADAMNDNKYLYPGFAHAVDENAPDGLFDGTQELWPPSDGADTLVGVFRQHILRVEHRSNREVVVFGCMFTFDSGTEVEDGYRVNASPFPHGGINPFRIALTTPQSETMLPPQEGPSRAALSDVFGGWRVTNHQGGFSLTNEWTDKGNESEACQARADALHADRRLVPASTYPRSDFEVLPAAPGWPEKAQ